jgi:hypothetical protein
MRKEDQEACHRQKTAARLRLGGRKAARGCIAEAAVKKMSFPGSCRVRK